MTDNAAPLTGERSLDVLDRALEDRYRCGETLTLTSGECGVLVRELDRMRATLRARESEIERLTMERRVAQDMADSYIASGRVSDALRVLCAHVGLEAPDAMELLAAALAEVDAATIQRIIDALPAWASVRAAAGGETGEP